MATLPEQIGFSTELQYVTQPTRTFVIDWGAKQISGMDDGLSAMRQAVEIILNNERFRWQIYSSNFGIETEDLPGEEYDYLVSEIPRRIRDACSVDNRILSADNFVFTDHPNGTLTCTFEVATVFGTISEEVTV